MPDDWLIANDPSWSREVTSQAPTGRLAGKESSSRSWPALQPAIHRSQFAARSATVLPTFLLERTLGDSRRIGDLSGRKERRDLRWPYIQIRCERSFGLLSMLLCKRFGRTTSISREKRSNKERGSVLNERTYQLSAVRSPTRRDKRMLASSLATLWTGFGSEPVRRLLAAVWWFAPAS